MRFKVQKVISIIFSALLLATANARDEFCPHVPLEKALTVNTYLPDPFTFFDGNSRVNTASDWTCRKDEIAQLFEEYELGARLPGPEDVSSTFEPYGNGTGGVLSVSASGAHGEILWSMPVSYPNVTTSEHVDGYPAIITFDFLAIPQPADVAIILFNVSEFAQQVNTSSRGKGKFYDYWGANFDTFLSQPVTPGALMAWSWGVSRIIDALTLPQRGNGPTDLKIDAGKIGVAGCSRYGKGSLVAGAFDDRVKLTIVQEPGAGGSGCWRMLDVENRVVDGKDVVQTAKEIVQENVWFSTGFEECANVTRGVQKLPLDQHMLTCLVAPRGLLFIENLGIQWLGPWSTYGCQVAGRKIYEALGARENVGLSQVSNHTHCQFPREKQGADLGSFVERFLLGKQVETDVWRTEADFEVTFDEGKWIDWDIPHNL